MNKITLAICAYNCEKYIEKTLNCIKSQTFQDFDLLIVNDCSTDSTKDYITNFFEKNPRPYELVDFEQNQGIAFGRKYVIENVNTKYILFVDADDKPYPNLVEKLYKKIKSDQDLMAVGCYLEYIDKAGNKIGGGLFIGEKTKEAFFKKAKHNKLIFMQPTAIFNRELAIKAGSMKTKGYFEEKPRYQDLCEDLDLWTRMSDFYTEGKAIVVIPEILCQYRKMEQTTSTNTYGMIIKIKYIKSNLLKRRQGKPEQTFIDFYNALTPKEHKSIKIETKSTILFREGIFALRKGNFFEGIIKSFQSIWLNPGYIYQKLKNNFIKK